LEDEWVFDGSHPFAMQHLLDVEDAMPRLFQRRRRNTVGDQLKRGRFFENARGIALRVPVDGAGGRSGGGRSDVGQLERGRIGDSVMMRGVEEPYRIVGCDNV
jgi:hypothetical protein